MNLSFFCDYSIAYFFPQCNWQFGKLSHRFIVQKPEISTLFILLFTKGYRLCYTDIIVGSLPLCRSGKCSKEFFAAAPNAQLCMVYAYTVPTLLIHRAHLYRSKKQFDPLIELFSSIPLKTGAIKREFRYDGMRILFYDNIQPNSKDTENCPGR